ncbi:hypothetical protein JOB18_041837 [Solea senegalensis]|uniref:Uncharacterized protein n=1 Tax=Solea senegalensis TaxID=28829 RepID=A0AAV6PQS2_SOLSE|nr:hypothetical protein JOB18_041837 [Solea senegalensis]
MFPTQLKSRVKTAQKTLNSSLNPFRSTREEGVSGLSHEPVIGCCRVTSQYVDLTNVNSILWIKKTKQK